MSAFLISPTEPSTIRDIGKVSGTPERSNREELAWAAGFFDGEGTFWAHEDPRGGWVTVRASLPQKEIELLERFTKAVSGIGGGISINEDSGCYRLQINSHEKTQAVIAMLWPFLGSAKREQAAQALERINEYFKEDRVWQRKTTQYCHCGKEVQARGLCNTHYWHWWKENREEEVAQ